MSLDDAAVAVTGAGAGMGRATARLFAEHGANVAVVDVDGEAAEGTADLLAEEGGTAIAIEGIREVGVVGEPDVRRTIAEPVTVDNEGGEVTLRPRDSGAGVRFEVSFRGETTPFLTDSPEEGVVHSVADLVSDVAVIGGFEDVVVEADLGRAYHLATVGAARLAHELGVVVERQV